MFRPLDDDAFAKPSEELRHFTDREDHRAFFQRMLQIQGGAPLPLLMFYGVGGAGKSWLLKHLYEKAADLPRAYLDLDPRSGGQAFLTNPPRALGDIRRQLGAAVPCPRFDLAYTWLNFKEGRADEPQFRGAGFFGHAWEFIVEAGGVAANDVPGISLVTWAINKVTGPAQDWLQQSGVADWLTSQLGQADFLHLKEALSNDIYPQLHRRLLQDLSEHLPARNGCAARGVVFIDTLESLRGHRDSAERLFEAQQWLRDLYHPDSGLLIVLAGRDRLNWDRGSDSSFAQPMHLEQQRIGGLSAADACDFLGRCGLDDRALQNAILAVCADKESSSVGAGATGYHAFSLGLCADTCGILNQRGETVDPSTFSMAANDTRALAARFLRSLGGDGAYAQWLKRLALTTRFDEAAARACFSSQVSAEQDFAWRSLAGYSFIRRAEESGWLMLHTRMREALDEIEQNDDAAHWRDGHQWWQAHWSSRSEHSVDRFAATAWYHGWCLDPSLARQKWDDLATTSRGDLRMADHYALLNWWAPCGLDEWLADANRRLEAASIFHDWGFEYWCASQGSRDANLRDAIACYEAALRVHTEEAFPQKWAMLQVDLGNAYGDLPSGDRDDNLRASIAYFEAALRVRTKEALPADWAVIQINLGSTYNDLPSGDREANLRAAIACYEAALRIHTEEAFPEDWAAAQNNLGNAYGALPSGDKDANLRAAIACYEAALRVRTEAAFPQNWAMVQNNLGSAYGALSSGDHDANLRAAIACHEAALRVRTEEAFPARWANSQANLGLAYFALPSGDRDANLRAAITCHEAALRFYTERDFPQSWAAGQYALGNAYYDLPSGDRDANLRAAITCYEAALRFHTEEAFPANWAAAQNNLGNAYRALRSGNRDTSLHNAIVCLEAALRVYTEEAFPEHWATSQYNLGNAYGDLKSGDRDANLRAAIACYEAALRIHTEEAFPKDWAAAQNNLGNAYYDLPSGDRDANLRAAIACYEAALRVYIEETFPREHAIVLGNLKGAKDKQGGDA